jgi:hypothetical protein
MILLHNLSTVDTDVDTVSKITKCPNRHQVYIICTSVLTSNLSNFFIFTGGYGLGYSNMNNFPETREWRARRRYSRDYYPNVSENFSY